MSTARLVRGAVILVFLGGIAGMIASSIAGSTRAAVTFGLLTSAAALCLLTVAAVAPSTADAVTFDESEAAELEGRIRSLVERGAPDDEVRDLVRMAVRLGRTGRLKGP